MTKKVFVQSAAELMMRIGSGRRVEGVLYVDENTGLLTFKAYNRQPHRRPKDRLLKKLPWGSVRESVERIKVFGSFPKHLGTSRVMSLVDDHTREAKNVLIERELDLIEYC